MSSEINKILDDCLNKVIIIKLKNRTILQGTLKVFDPHMNLLLENSQDITEDKAKNLDKIILRGDNIIAVSLQENE